MNLLQIYCRVGYCKKIENRLIFSEVMAKSLVSCFLTHGVDIMAPLLSHRRLFTTFTVGYTISDVFVAYSKRAYKLS